MPQIWLRIVATILGFIGFAPTSGSSKTKTVLAYDFSFQSIEGDFLPLSQFAGKPILIVNTASQCGFTRQYKGLVEIWKRYREKGVIVLAVPSNDFGGQEPGSANEIKSFCEVIYGIDFPMTKKVHVIGENAHPFYKWAAAELGSVSRPRWNFHKYLISADGKLVNWFSSVTYPTSKKMLHAIESTYSKIA